MSGATGIRSRRVPRKTDANPARRTGGRGAGGSCPAPAGGGGAGQAGGWGGGVFVADPGGGGGGLWGGDMGGGMMVNFFPPLLGFFGLKIYHRPAGGGGNGDVGVEYSPRHNWIVGSPATVTEK